MLCGLLECAECGGGFYVIQGGGICGCGWARDRGPAVCASSLRVRGIELEARIVGAIRDDILTPANLEYVVSHAVERAGEVGSPRGCQGQAPPACTS